MNNIYPIHRCLLALLLTSIITFSFAQNPISPNLRKGASTTFFSKNSSTCVEGTYYAGTSGQSLNLVSSSNDPQFLCMNDLLDIQHNGDQIISDDPNPLTPPGISYVFYQCEPYYPVLEVFEIEEDSCLLPAQFSSLPFYLVDGVIDINGTGTFENNGGLQGFFNEGAPLELWFAPMVVHNHADITMEVIGNGSNDICSHITIEDAFKVVYLNAIETTVINENSIVVEGGLPEFDGSSYAISVHLEGNPSTAASILTPDVSHGDTLVYTTPVAGNYHIIIEDGKSCGAEEQNFSNTITCGIPINTQINVTTPTNALATWDASFEATGYQIWYRIKGTSNWTVKAASSPQRNLTNLIKNKYYQYKIRANCSSGWTDFSGIEVFYTSPCDIIPTGITAIYVDNTRMRIKWDNIDEVKAKVRYREIGTSTWHAQNSADGNNFVWINNLTPNATYQYRVRSNCEGNNWSAYSASYFHDLMMPRMAMDKFTKAAIIYPNPANDILNIEFEMNRDEKINILIFDQLGKVIHTLSESYPEGIQRESMDVSSFAAGHYIITIQGNDMMETFKFVKTK